MTTDDGRCAHCSYKVVCYVIFIREHFPYLMSKYIIHLFELNKELNKHTKCFRCLVTCRAAKPNISRELFLNVKFTCKFPKFCLRRQSDEKAFSP